jgi:hypothetical protein
VFLPKYGLIVAVAGYQAFQVPMQPRQDPHQLSLKAAGWRTGFKRKYFDDFPDLLQRIPSSQQ